MVPAVESLTDEYQMISYIPQGVCRIFADAIGTSDERLLSNLYLD